MQSEASNQNGQSFGLRAAASEFEITPDLGAMTDHRTKEKAVEVVGPLKTTLLLLESDAIRVCLITTHFGPSTPVNVSDLFRETIAKDLGLPVSQVLLMTSHNHCSVSFAENGVLMYNAYSESPPPAELLPVGKEFLKSMREHAKRLPEMLEEVSIWWGEGREDRITYNRKGLREDGSSYFIREKERELLGDDFSGEIETCAPLIVLKNHQDEPVAAFAQFTGHPVTAYNPEKTIIFGEWPQVACDILAAKLRSERSSIPNAVPVGFLQGCAGDINSKEMFFGGVERSTEFGEMLAESYLDAMKSLRRSKSSELAFQVKTVKVPLAPVPARKLLEAELAEMDDFISRAKAGDEEMLNCVGLNFPEALSPAFRAKMVELVRPWNIWGIVLHETGSTETVEKNLEMEIAVLRIGDVGIVGMPCEPFHGVGTQIRENSPLPLTIPCGYMNVSHGYIPDSENIGGQEYMSSHHRYTRFRPPLEKPAGDVLAQEAIQILNQFVEVK
ncbi:hypothetical protein [Thalassoglobus sp.]|uniref:hypothetical protein n=1 Tax=Thalassoglobus sp. TaxID=2795869 RepID=UPI003AA99E3D